MTEQPGICWVITCTTVGQPTLMWRLPSGDFEVGRDPACQVVLPGKRVSRRHVRLHVGPPGPSLLVEDLKSFNGTFVDGVRVTQAQLLGREHLTVGEWELRLRPALPVDGVVPWALPASVEVTNRALEESGPGPMFRDDARLPATADVDNPPLPPVVDRDSGGSLPPLPPPGRGASGPNPAPSLVPRPVGGAWTPAAARLRSTVIPRVDVRWQPREQVAESVRERAVQNSPLVRHVTQHAIPLAIGNLQEARDLAALAQDRDAAQELALRLVYKVAADLQAAQGEDDFLSHMTETLLTATHAQTVAILMSQPSGAETPGATSLVPKSVRWSGGGANPGISRGVAELALTRRVAVSTEDAQRDARFSWHASVLDLDLKAVLAVPMLRQEGPVGVVYLTRRTPFTDAEQDLAAALGHLTALGVERARLKEKVAEELALRQTLERFHTPEVVEKLMEKQAAQGQGPHLFLETITATVLFCDLCGFTSYCDKHSAAEVAELLNGYLGEMTRVVYEFHGTVDKYIGDAVMAVFGAPFPSEDDAERAARCGLAMQEAFDVLMSKRPERERLKLRIGINTGQVVAGTVGSPLRMEYTCLGDTVNVAQRLESIAIPGQVLVGRTTAEAISHLMDVRACGAVSLKGKSGAVETFEVVGDKGKPQRVTFGGS